MKPKEYRRFINELVRRDREIDPDGQSWATSLTDAQKDSSRIVQDYAHGILMTGTGIISALVRATMPDGD